MAGKHFRVNQPYLTHKNIGGVYTTLTRNRLGNCLAAFPLHPECQSGFGRRSSQRSLARKALHQRGVLGDVPSMPLYLLAILSHWAGARRSYTFLQRRSRCYLIGLEHDAPISASHVALLYLSALHVALLWIPVQCSMLLCTGPRPPSNSRGTLR